MITVVYPPDAHVIVYVLEGTGVMQLKGGKEITLTPGQSFYEGPNGIHVVGRNPSTTKPASGVTSLKAWDLMESRFWGVLRGRVPAYYLTAPAVVASRHGKDSALVEAAAVVIKGFFNSLEQTDRSPSNSVSIRASA